MKNLNYLLFAFAAVIFMNSCKEEEITEPPVGEFSSIFNYLDEKQSDPQSFTIAAGSESIITGEKGTQITFNANSFVFLDGTPATGFIDIQLLEIQTNADMIFNNVFPLSDGNILNSGGMYRLTASQLGNPLKLASGAYYEAVLPAQAYDPGMGFYSGADDGTGVNWTFISPYSDSVRTYDFFNYDAIESSYSILCDSIGWCNCDYFGGDPVVSCTFNLSGPATLSALNTVAYAVLDGENAVFPLNSPLASVISQSGIGIVPMHVLIISVITGTLYYGLLPVTPAEGGIYNITMTETTDAELTAIILSLP